MTRSIVNSRSDDDARQVRQRRGQESTARTIRVASVPAGHVYVRHLASLSNADGVVRLPDPPPARPASPGQWWPPAMLEPAWIEEHADEFDLMHVHFGFDALDAHSLTEFVHTLRRHNKPLIYTAHDLRNPHHQESAAHDAHLNVLIPCAERVITLTAGAAAEIRSRWGRVAEVLPHPHVVDLVSMARMSRSRPRSDRFTVGVHVKSMRAAMAPEPVLHALLRLAHERREPDLVVDVHRDVAESDGAHHDASLMALLEDSQRQGLLRLHVHDYYTDAQLWDYLESLDLSVLPYRFGTHSGWLEACYDLGTPVLAPDCGYYDQQRPCLVYGHTERGLDAQSLRIAVATAMAAIRARTDRVNERTVERETLAAHHRAVYEQVLA